MNILVVDDEIVMIETLRRGVTSKGHKVFEALSAKEALDQLEKNSGTIDIVLTDYMMLGDTGLKLLRKIRERYGPLPVIMMTAYGEKELVLDALRNRCNGFIEKPFTFSKLIEEIERTQLDILRNTASDQFSKLIPRLIHQMNNPLSSIWASAKLAEMKADNEKATKRYAENIIECVVKIKEINDNLLRLGKTDSGKIERIRIRPLLEKCLKMFKDLLDLKGIHCEEIEWSHDPVHIIANRFELEQAFKNLILNAIDAMDGCHQKLLKISADVDEAAHSVSVHVVDTGCGIPVDQKEKIFDQHYTGKIGGNGLGLSIAKRIVEKHGGSIHVHSQVGEGTTFTVTLLTFKE